MKIIPLSEGSFTVDKTKQFVPFDESTQAVSDRPRGSLLVEVQPFLLITEKDVLLVDAGLGFTNTDGVLQIHQHVMDHGVNPSEVTKVLMSHLHKDHSGGIGYTHSGNVAGDKRAADTLSFPNAQYIIQRKELELALSGESSSYILDDLQCLKGSDRVQLVDGDGTLDGYIRYEMTAAHSPFHQVFWLTENGQTVFFGGDDAPQYPQMKSRYVAKYDYDGKKCMELRQQWWEQGKKEKWTFLFYHDIKKAAVEPD